MATWLTSDLHLFHRNIIKYCDRPFCDEYEMNKHIVDTWNSVVKDGDRVIVVGDLTAGLSRRDQELKDIIASLRGNKFLVMGNHDHMKQTWYLDAGFSGVSRYIIEDNVLYIHKPRTEMNVETINVSKKLNPRLIVHGHIHDLRPELDGHFNVAWDRHLRMIDQEEIFKLSHENNTTKKSDT